MSKIVDGYEIRLAEYDEIDKIMSFIRDNWSANHIMSYDREYFEFEFVIDGKVNVVLATDTDTGEQVGMLGFLPCSMDSDHLDVFGSIWIVTTEQKLGIAMDEYLREVTDCCHRVGVGLNRHTAVPMVRFYIGDRVGKMNQFYMLNPEKTEYSLVIQADDYIEPDIPDDGYRLRQINTYEELAGRFDFTDKNKVPYKDGWYYRHHFFDNPRRDYKLYLIEDGNGRSESFMVTRDCAFEGAKALRIVDFYGKTEDISHIGHSVNELLCVGDYEYADCYNFGIDKEIFFASGFRLRHEDNAVIPNHYEPFEKENVEIWVRYTDENTVFFKADGDQDRANKRDVKE